MDSFLTDISKYANKIDYPHNTVCIKFDSVPESFHEVALDYISRSNIEINRKTFKLDYFKLYFNDNLECAMVFYDPISKSQYIIKQENAYFKGLSGWYIKEKVFLHDIRLKEDYHYSNVLNSLPERERKYVKTLSEKEKMFTSEMLKSLETIKGYMKWIVKETNIIDAVISDEIKYKVNPMDSDAKKRNFKGTESERQWLNDPIAFSKRINELNKYKSIYDIKASEIDESLEKDIYYVKVFSTKNKIVLIMEPKEARKYTKIKYIDSEMLTKEQTKQIAIETLSLNKEEITEQGDITRHTHTTIEEYRKLLKYVLKNVDDGLRYSTIERIKDANKNAKRIV